MKWIISLMLVMAVNVMAADVLRIYTNSLGVVNVVAAKSFPEETMPQPNEIIRAVVVDKGATYYRRWTSSLDLSAYMLPYWDGANIVEAPQAVKDAVDAMDTQAALDVENASAPNTGWVNLERRDKFMLLVLYKLAKQHWPALTQKQFMAQIRTEWDATK